MWWTACSSREIPCPCMPHRFRSPLHRMSALRLLGSAAIFFLHASAYLHEIDVSDRVSLTAGYHISETIQAGEGDRQSVGVIVTDDTFLPAPATRHGPSYDAGDFTLQLIQCSNHAQYLALDLKEPCPATTGEETPLGRPLKDDTLSSCHVISSVPLNDSHINLQSNWALGHLDPDAELELYLCIASPITSPMPSQLPTVFVSRVRINIDVRFKRGYLVQGLEPLRRVLIGLMLTSGPILFLHLYAHAPAPNERRLWAPSALQKETDWTRMHSVFVVVVIAKVFELVIQYTGLQRLNRTGLRDVAFAAMFDGPGIVTGCLLFIALFCATKGYMITRRRLTRRELFNMFLNALVVAAALLGSKVRAGCAAVSFHFLGCAIQTVILLVVPLLSPSYRSPARATRPSSSSPTSSFSASTATFSSTSHATPAFSTAVAPSSSRRIRTSEQMPSERSTAACPPPPRWTCAKGSSP